MQFVEIPRSVISLSAELDELYEKPDKSTVELFTAEDDVKIATLFKIYKEPAIQDHVLKQGLVLCADSKAD